MDVSKKHAFFLFINRIKQMKNISAHILTSVDMEKENTWAKCQGRIINLL